MKTARFTNFSSEPFSAYWNGKPVGVAIIVDPLDNKKKKGFPPGASAYLPDYLAAHLAKHLTNRELLKKNLERSTSPKRPQDVPEYMDLFNQAFEAEEDDIDTTEVRDEVEVQMEVIQRKKGITNELQTPTMDDEDEEEGEEAFAGRPADGS